MTSPTPLSIRIFNLNPYVLQHLTTRSSFITPPISNLPRVTSFLEMPTNNFLYISRQTKHRLGTKPCYQKIQNSLKMMFEEPIWNVFTSWFTPTTLFLLLNFMIVTIFFTSGFGSNKSLTKTDLLHQQQQESHQGQTEPILLQRSPSVLQRLKSINFYHYNHYSKPVEPINTTTSFRENKVENDDVAVHEAEEHDLFDFDDEDSDQEKSIEDVYGELQHKDSKSNFIRTRSDTEPASGAVPVKLVKKMKKSASSKSAFKHFSAAEVLEARRPATVREVKAAKMAAVDDEEVDSKADDFINKFKHQLKLQRLDSILRYKEMLGRGAGK